MNPKEDKRKIAQERNFEPNPDIKNILDKFDLDYRVDSNGFYNSYGFYILTDNSFFDHNGIYFNTDGFDKYGGSYDNKFEYLPGNNWNDKLLCYNQDLNYNLTEELENLLIENDIALLKQEYQLRIKEYKFSNNIDDSHDIDKDKEEERYNEEKTIQEFVKLGFIKKD
jgi:hypothetical protein